MGRSFLIFKMSNPFSKYKFDRSKQLKRNDSSSSNSRGIENGMTGSLTSNGSLEYTMEEPDSPNFLDTSIVNNKESNTLKMLESDSEEEFLKKSKTTKTIKNNNNNNSKNNNNNNNTNEMSDDSLG